MEEGRPVFVERRLVGMGQVRERESQERKPDERSDERGGQEGDEQRNRDVKQGSIEEQRGWLVIFDSAEVQCWCVDHRQR